MKARKEKISNLDKLRSTKILYQVEKVISLQEIKRLSFDKKYKEIRQIFQHLGSGILKAKPFPKGLEDMPSIRTSGNNRVEFFNEFEWYGLLLEQFIPQLKLFLEIRSSLEQARLVKNLPQIKDELEKLKAQFGVSHFFYERQREYLHWVGDEQADEEIANIVGSNTDLSVRFVLAANYFRYHPLYVYQVYFKVLFNNIANFKNDLTTGDILGILYFSDSASPIDANQFIDLFGLADQVCIIDLYEIYIYVIQISALLNFEKREITAINTISRRLSFRIEDSRLSPLTKKINNNQDLEQAEIFERFAVLDLGEFLKNQDLFIEYRGNCNDIENSSYLSRIINVTNNVLHANGPIELTIAELENWSSEFGRCRLSNSVYALSRYLRGVESLNNVSPFLAQQVSQKELTGESCFVRLFTVYEEIKLEVRSYIKKGQVRAGCRLLLDLWKNNSWIIHVAGVSSLLEVYIKNECLRELDDFPIIVAYGLMDQSVKFTSTLDAFLYFIEISSISELAEKLPQEDQWIYELFASDVCGLSILKQIPSIGATMQEVRAERVRVLKQLINRNPSKQDFWKNEVFELEKRNRIEGANVIIDQSRMMIDRAILEKKISSFLSAKIGDLPVTELTDSLIESLVLYTVGIFLLDPDCGLDAVLSGRIRHGNLRERLRSPFARNGLVFFKRGGVYTPNDSWKASFLSEEEDKEEVVNLISEISLKVDSVINKFVNDRIQFSMETYSWDGFSGMMTAKHSPLGLLNTDDILSKSTKAIRQQIPSVHSVASLVSLCTECMWRALNPELEKVKYEINGALRNNLFGLLDTQVAKFSEIPEWQRSFVRDAMGRCRSEIDGVCVETARWFDLPKELIPPQVNVGEMIELVAESIRRYTGGNFNPVIISGEDLKVSERFFSDFYDLINLCFVNIVEHSGLEPEATDTSIYVEEQQTGVYTFRCYNLTKGDALLHVEKASRQIQENNNLGQIHKINNEGKSGLAKAAQILAKSNSGRGDIAVFSDNDKFCLQGQLSAGIFAKS